MEGFRSGGGLIWQKTSKIGIFEGQNRDFQKSSRLYTQLFVSVVFNFLRDIFSHLPIWNLTKIKNFRGGVGFFLGFKMLNIDHLSPLRLCRSKLSKNMIFDDFHKTIQIVFRWYL